MKFIKHQSNYRAQYSHTDQMGVVHHSEYIKYYEYARWELLRFLGCSYNEIELSGWAMPVIQLESKYLKPVYYDDNLLIVTTLHIEGAKLNFNYKIYNESKQLVNEGSTIIVTVSKLTKRPVKLIKSLVELFNIYSIDFQEIEIAQTT